jgi:hypothetical protein
MSLFFNKCMKLNISMSGYVNNYFYDYGLATFLVQVFSLFLHAITNVPSSVCVYVISVTIVYFSYCSSKEIRCIYKSFDVIMCFD